MKHYEDIVDELQAKAHQSTYAGAMPKITFAGARLRRLFACANSATRAKLRSGWRCFWKGIFRLPES